jgi:uncharacterized SAM-binding protein YcdF (DUF218 family)
MTAGARRLVVAVVLLVVPAGVAVLGLMNAAQWLRAAEEPRAADAIVVLAGEPLRAQYAADLFKAGHAPRVLVSRPARYPREKMLDDLGVPFPRAEDVYLQVLVKLGVPAERIAVFGKDSISTVDEALALRQQFSGAPAKLLIVTSPYHARRARMVFHDYLPQVEVHVVVTPYESYPDAWWRSQDAARNVVLELAKIAYYLVGGRFAAAP